jgi:hypothetical protein
MRIRNIRIGLAISASELDNSPASSFFFYWGLASPGIWFRSGIYFFVPLLFLSFLLFSTLIPFFLLLFHVIIFIFVSLVIAEIYDRTGIPQWRIVAPFVFRSDTAAGTGNL